MGPGGIFRGLRAIPALVDIAWDMQEISKPNAVMLQYANPMAANCEDVTVKQPLAAWILNMQTHRKSDRHE